jgi:hypothetical protein
MAECGLGQRVCAAGYGTLIGRVISGEAEQELAERLR